MLSVTKGGYAPPKRKGRNIMKRTGLWRGLSSLMCFILALSIIAGNALEANAQPIDNFLGTQSEKIVSDGALYDKFTPSAEVLFLKSYFEYKSVLSTLSKLDLYLFYFDYYFDFYFGYNFDFDF